MKVDINCDMGEGMPNDEMLMPFIHSANIACGRHAGSPGLMERTMEKCLEHGVKAGAHPGFDDKENFGRKEQRLEKEALFELVYLQVRDALEAAARTGLHLHHVKPHGALYNMAAKDKTIAHTIAGAVAEADPSLVFYGLSGSDMITAARSKGLSAAQEVFADRAYGADGQLLSRSDARALITDPVEAWEHVKRMVFEKHILTVDGSVLPVEADTLCIHGDHPRALDIARYLHTQLLNNPFRS